MAAGVNARLVSAVRPMLRGEGAPSAEDLRRAAARVRFGVTEIQGAERLAVQNAADVEHFNSREIHRTIGVAVPEFSTEIGRRWQSDHVALIKSLAEEPKRRVLEMLREGIDKGSRVETLIKRFESELEINHRRARLIARDQVLTLNAKLTRDRHERAGITEYTWLTLGPSEDAGGSTRSHHAALNGKRFKYAEPPMGGGTSEFDAGHPGDGIGCRCQAIPYVPELETKRR